MSASDTPETRCKIRILDETTSNQIAAGEVVERPVSAVKELVENAIDAGARHVEVDLEDGGRRLIRVTDDGCGMSREDAVLSLQRHATSKISASEDLFRITTMGFRGEALPSIASVSQLTLITKEQNREGEPGTKIEVFGGSIENVSPIGTPAGASIAVENLFFNVPARLKFLRTASTELNHSLEMVQRFALARPDIAFRLCHNGSEVFAASGSGSHRDSAVEVLGRAAARHLLQLDYRSAGIVVAGFIGSPEAMKSSRSEQHAFVNGRFVRIKAVTRAIDEAYRSVQTIHGARFPIAVIRIEIDPAAVDVNVSPTKTEVRFTRESDVYVAVYHAVQEALMAGGLVPTAGRQISVASAPEQSNYGALLSVTSRLPVRPGGERENAGNTGFPRRTSLETPNEPWIVKPAIAEASGVDRAMGQDYRSHDLGSVQVLGQTRNTYIIAQTDQALLLIDQHIAHERVLYERLLAGVDGGGIAAQRLIIPMTVDFSRQQSLVIEKRLPELAKAGFELEPFGGDSYLVRSVPASLVQKSLKAQDGPEATLRAIVDEMVEKTVSRRLLLPAEEVLISASCKMAVKAGDPLSFEEMTALVSDLLRSQNPYTCPHGRPIIVELANRDIDRKFGR